MDWSCSKLTNIRPFGGNEKLLSLDAVTDGSTDEVSVEHSGRIKRTPPPTLELGPVKLKYLLDPSVEQRSLVLAKGSSCPLAAGVLLGLRCYIRVVKDDACNLRYTWPGNVTGALIRCAIFAFTVPSSKRVPGDFVNAPLRAHRTKVIPLSSCTAIQSIQSSSPKRATSSGRFRNCILKI